MRLLIYISALLVGVSCLCGNITIGADSYDLSYLSKLAPSGNLTFGLCSPITCTRYEYKYSTLITDSNSTEGCIPLTRTI